MSTEGATTAHPQLAALLDALVPPRHERLALRTAAILDALDHDYAQIIRLRNAAIMREHLAASAVRHGVLTGEALAREIVAIAVDADEVAALAQLHKEATYAASVSVVLTVACTRSLPNRLTH